MLDLLRLVRDLCQLRRGPQDFPHSVSLLIGLIGANLLVQVGAELLVDSKASGLLAEGVALALILSLAYVALSTRGLSNRFVQTATALLLCTLTFKLLILPVVLLALPPPPSPEELKGRHVLMALVAFGLGVWKLSVDAHILRHALDTRFAIGFALALAWAIAAFALGQSLLGASGG